VQGDTLKLGVDRRGDGLHEVVRCALRADTLAADILNGNDKADEQERQDNHITENGKMPSDRHMQDKLRM
jgi:hypothetical protein